MMTDSSAQEDQQCNAAKLLEVTILQCRGQIDHVWQWLLSKFETNVVYFYVTIFENHDKQKLFFSPPLV